MYFKIVLNSLLLILIINLKFCFTILPCSYEYDVVSDIGPQECKKLGKFYEKNVGEDHNDCLPGCIEKLGIDKKCTITKKCAPGLKCKELGSKCLIDESSCAKYEYLELPAKAWKPVCLSDGTYAPKQCKGETENGRCFCYDAYGKRIFGQEWSAKAKDMTCACSRHRAELEAQGRKNVTLHCDSQGNYEPLQCDSGLCWCAESKTGEILAAVVPEAMMTFLPCYDRNEIGEQYLRQCESQAFGQSKILEELQAHGTLEASLPFILCDWDGSYGKYRIEKGVAYCTKRDKSNAGTWATSITANMEETLNCNCARDSVLYEELGMILTFNCEGNGNYQQVQSNTNGEFFCVDSDGFAVTEPQKEAINKDDCPKS